MPSIKDVFEDRVPLPSDFFKAYAAEYRNNPYRGYIPAQAKQLRCDAVFSMSTADRVWKNLLSVYPKPLRKRLKDVVKLLYNTLDAISLYYCSEHGYFMTIESIEQLAALSEYMESIDIHNWAEKCKKDNWRCSQLDDEQYAIIDSMHNIMYVLQGIVDGYQEFLDGVTGILSVEFDYFNEIVNVIFDNDCKDYQIDLYEVKEEIGIKEWNSAVLKSLEFDQINGRFGGDY
mgnify:CR=1 FL=1